VSETLAAEREEVAMPLIIFACQCGAPLKARPETAGKRTKCPHCGAILTIPGGVKSKVPATVASDEDLLGSDLDWSTIEVDSKSAFASSVEIPATSQSSGAIPIIPSLAMVESAPAAEVAPVVCEGPVKQYKVLTQKEMGVAIKFDPVKFEETLNALARQGWSLKAVVTMNLPSHSGHHDELIAILERS
jgi:hypothetical protein